MAHHTAGITKRVLKVMGIFTSLQMVNILCSAVKMKLVALWLGPGGVGTFGIFQSVFDTSASVTDMGTRQSAVRNVAANAKSPGALARVATVVRRLNIWLGLAGAIIVAALALPLSRCFFHTYSWWWGFALLSMALFLNSMSGGEQAILQGSGKFKRLARANLAGTLCGLAFSIPAFLFLGEKSVPLSITIYAVSAWMAYRFVRKPVIHSEGVTPRQAWHEGKGFVKLGIYMAAAGFATTLGHTVFIGILNGMTTLDNVGFVQAGETVIVRYLGLVFVAVSTEFYPRLAANISHPSRIQTFVNHEILLLIKLLTPLMAVFILMRGVVVEILYDSGFECILPLLGWGALSSIPKAVSWSMAYTIVAKGDGKVFTVCEVTDALISVPLCVLAWHWWGMTGLGIAYILWYLLYCAVTYSVYRWRYGYRLSMRVPVYSVISLGILAGVMVVA